MCERKEMEVSDIHPFHQPQNQTLVEITLQIKQLNFREEEKKKFFKNTERKTKKEKAANNSHT